MDVLVQQGPGGGEAQGAGGHALAHDLGHLGDLARVGLVVGVATVPEDIGPDRAVGHVDAHVDGAGLGLQGVEVFGEGLPLPVDALGQGGAGNVLDPFHELDQEVLATGADGGEADPAVAHDGRGHAMPAGGRHDRIPGGLAVIVGVDVHPAGGDNQAPGVDLAPGGAFDLAHGDDAVALDPDVRAGGRRARPVHHSSAPDDQVQHVVVFPNERQHRAGLKFQTTVGPKPGRFPVLCPRPYCRRRAASRLAWASVCWSFPSSTSTRCRTPVKGKGATKSDTAGLGARPISMPMKEACAR